MRTYQLVWFFILIYMGYKGTLSITGKGSFFGTSIDYLYDELDANGILQHSNTTQKIKESYLVQIGSETNKYSYYFQSETVIISFGGTRRDIFEKTLLRLNIDKMITVVNTDVMRTKVSNDIRSKNATDRWFLIYSVSKKGRNDRTDIRRVFGKMQTLLNTTALTDSTVIFDLGTYSASYLKKLILLYSSSCKQFILYNRKKVMTNLQSIQQMMQRAGYRPLRKVKSKYIATFVSKDSLLWK